MSEEAESETGAVGARAPKDLALEMMRQHNLLTMMAGRLNEVASGLDRGAVKNTDRIVRALDVHFRFLIRIHDAFESLILNALSTSRRATVRAHVRACRESHPEAEVFQRSARALIASGPMIAPSAIHPLAELFRREAERIEAHDAREDELYRQLDQILPDDLRRKLLRSIRRFDEERVVAEISLISWAAQVHPSAD